MTAFADRPDRNPFIFGRGQFAIVPENLVTDRHLSLRAKFIFTAMCLHAGGDGYCKLKIRTIAEKTDMSVRSVQYRMRELENAGRVVRHGDTGDGEIRTEGRQGRTCGYLLIRDDALLLRPEVTHSDEQTGAGSCTPPVQDPAPVEPTGVQNPAPHTSRKNNTPVQEAEPSVDNPPVEQRQEKPRARQRVRGGRDKAPRRPSAGQGEMLLPIAGVAQERAEPTGLILYIRFGDDRRAVAMTETQRAQLWRKREGGTVPDHVLDEAIRRHEMSPTVAGHLSSSEADNEDTRPRLHAAGPAPGHLHSLSADPLLRQSAEDPAAPTECATKQSAGSAECAGRGGDPPSAAAGSISVEPRPRREAAQ